MYVNRPGSILALNASSKFSRHLMWYFRLSSTEISCMISNWHGTNSQIRIFLQNKLARSIQTWLFQDIYDDFTHGKFYFIRRNLRDIANRQSYSTASQYVIKDNWIQHRVYVTVSLASVWNMTCFLVNLSNLLACVMTVIGLLASKWTWIDLILMILVVRNCYSWLSLITCSANLWINNYCNI